MRPGKCVWGSWDGKASVGDRTREDGGTSREGEFGDRGTLVTSLGNHGMRWLHWGIMGRGGHIGGSWDVGGFNGGSWGVVASM